MTDLKNLSSSFINGKWIAVPKANSEAFFKINPADNNDRMGPIPTSLEHVDQAVECAQMATTLWRKIPSQKRWEYLSKLKDLVSKHTEILAQSITREIGKPIWESRLEVKAVLNKFTITESAAQKWVEDFSVSSSNDRIQAVCKFKPHGVLVVLGPFNFPLHLVMGHVIPALANGNCVILKPSDKAPLTSMLLAELFLQAQFPSGVFGMVQGQAAVGEKLVKHSGVDGVLFTGSYGVGRKIKIWTLDQPAKILALEMGGKNTSIIWHDAALEASAAAVLQSATLTCGQRCTATSHLLVHEKVMDQVTAMLQHMLGQITIGDPLQETTFLGPIISSEAQQRFFEAEKKAIDLGGKKIGDIPAAAISNRGYFVAPQLHRFEQLPRAEDFARGFFDEEIFGPALNIFPFREPETATKFINQSQYGLALSVFSKEKNIFETFSDLCRVGVCNWNRPTTGASSALPFGGQKASGNHFPTALFASRYCTYPVAQLQEPDACTLEKMNGFNGLIKN